MIFIGHEFNKYLSFNSEFELEHGLVKDDNGELELEQMYLEQNLEYMGLNNTFIKYGVFLIPVGITNETHEPPTFYGVERNVVEKELNANTWWEGGISAQTALGETADITFAVHSGLDNASGDIRSGRGKMQEQDGSNIDCKRTLVTKTSSQISLNRIVPAEIMRFISAYLNTITCTIFSTAGKKTIS